LKNDSILGIGIERLKDFLIIILDVENSERIAEKYEYLKNS